MNYKPRARWQHSRKRDSIAQAIATFLQKCHRGKNIALWSKEGAYLGHFEWSRTMHFPITKSAHGRTFETVVI